MVVSTYQAASGAGAAAMEELVQQTREVLLLFLTIPLTLINDNAESLDWCLLRF